MMKRFYISLLILLMLVEVASAQDLTVYSGRNEAFMDPVIEAFEAATGIDVAVRYGDTAALAAQILEEDKNSPADIFLAQDAGALGAIAKTGLFRPLPEDILSKVASRFRSKDGLWVGVTGRARVLVVAKGVDNLPQNIFELAQGRYKSRVGWAPANGSFQAFVTAMRVIYGEQQTSQWLRDMVANDTQVYAKNTPIIEAVGRNEIDFGLVNHYYLYRFTVDNPDFPAYNYVLPDADIGALVNVAGAGLLSSSANQAVALQLIAFLLSPEAQRHFANEVHEYPLAEGVAAHPDLLPLSELETPDIDLSDLDDLEGTLELLQETGALE